LWDRWESKSVTVSAAKGAMLDMAPFATLRVTGSAPGASPAYPRRCRSTPDRIRSVIPQTTASCTRYAGNSRLSPRISNRTV
jgi:hypothetical protein